MDHKLSSSGVWVPRGHAQRNAAHVVPDATQGEYQQTILKALVGDAPRATPRQILPQMFHLGMYQGIKTPAQISLKTVEFLRRIARTPITSIVIRKIIKQGQSFGHRPRSENDPGFKIVVADREDEELTPEEQKQTDEITTFMEQGGYIHARDYDGAMGAWSGDGTEEADRLPVLLAKLIEDSLTLDWATIRVEPGMNEKRNPIAFMRAADAGRIRMTEHPPPKPVKDTFGNVLDLGYTAQHRTDINVEFVEIGDGNEPINEFTYDEIIPFVRNHRSNVMALGYGWPELAELVEHIAGMLVATQHNVQYFTSNRIPPGIISVAGNYDEEWQNAFLMQILAQGTEGNQAYKVPILFGDTGADTKFIPFRTKERDDMYWRQWLIYLINIICAALDVAAEEVGFQAFLSAGGQQTGTGGDQRVNQSRWTGLRTLMEQLEGLLNRRVVSRFFPDSTGYGPYRLRFVNLVPRDEERERKFETDDLASGMLTVNTAHVARGERPVKDPIDRDLAERVMRGMEKHRSDLQHDDRDKFLDLYERTYEQEGGKWAMWPDAPTNPTLNMIWSQEHAQDLEPEVDEDEQWAQAQQGGPPQGFTDKMDVEAWKAAKEKEQDDEDGDLDEDDEARSPVQGEKGQQWKKDRDPREQAEAMNKGRVVNVFLRKGQLLEKAVGRVIGAPVRFIKAIRKRSEEKRLTKAIAKAEGDLAALRGEGDDDGGSSNGTQ